CAISNEDTETPPAFAAFAGANKTLLLRKMLIASNVDGMFAPSPTALTPLSTSCFADASSISFCVAQGNAISHGIVQIPEHPSWYSASGWSFTYSLMR